MKIDFNARSAVQFNKDKKELVEKIKNSLVNAKTIRRPDGDYITKGYLDWLYLLGITDKVFECGDEEEIRDMAEDEYTKFGEVTGLSTTGGPRVCLVRIIERGVMYEISMVAYSAPIIVALSKLFPNVRFRVSDREESMFGINCNVYHIENGVVESKNAKKHANKCIGNGQYFFAITALLPFAIAGDDNAKNDIGVCYERMYKYKTASVWYEKSNLEISKENLLLQYDNNRIPLDSEKYIELCNYLISKGNSKGYLYLSYLYQREDGPVADGEKAIEVLNEGLNKPFCGRLMFEKAYLLNLYDKDLVESHNLYKRLLNSHDEFTETARYNYALQCWTARGCEKNMTECIVWLTIAAMNGYRDAFTKLIEIYETEEGFINEEQAEVWKTLEYINECSTLPYGGDDDYDEE